MQRQSNNRSICRHLVEWRKTIHDPQCRAYALELFWGWKVKIVWPMWRNNSLYLVSSVSSIGKTWQEILATFLTCTWIFSDALYIRVPLEVWHVLWRTKYNEHWIKHIFHLYSYIIYERIKTFTKIDTSNLWRHRHIILVRKVLLLFR